MKIQRKLPAMFLAIWVLLTSALQAEALLDGSLGSEGSFSGNFTITHDMGKLRKNNLFHSFQSFNINIGESATFTGPDSVRNVISRVTGGNSSWIDGTISSTMPNADFYLLNSNGIVFGDNASLDVQGSFHASTADYLQLEDGQRFYASLSSDSSFTVASPASFGFLDNPDSPPTGITINGSFLRVNAEKTLSLVGGDLNLNGGMLYAPDGKINLVSVASAGEVNPGLSNSAEKLGSITIAQGATKGKEIFIQGGHFHLQSGYIISDVTHDKALVRDNVNQRGKITILAKEMIELKSSNISADAKKDTNHDAGNILIETPTMEFYKGCKGCGISSDTYGKGNGGNIHITASDSLSIFGGIISVVSTQEGTGNAGKIDLEVGKLVLETGTINSGTLGSGEGGKIDINATQAVSLLEKSKISATSGDNKISATGKGGNIFIKAPRLDIMDGSAVQTGAFSSSTGDAGDIDIIVDHLKLKNGSTIISSNAGDDESGKLSIVANVDIELNRSSIFLFTKDKYEAGSLNITANNLSLFDNSFITSLADQGSGSHIDLQVHNRLNLNNSFILTRVYGSDEDAGDIKIDEVQDFTMKDGQILTTGLMGDGGNINIQADNLTVLGNSWIDVSSKYGVNGELILNDTKLPNIETLPPLGFLGADLPMDRCAGFGKEDISKFIITIRDVLPPTPEDLRM